MSSFDEMRKKYGTNPRAESGGKGAAFDRMREKYGTGVRLTTDAAGRDVADPEFLVKLFPVATQVKGVESQQDRLQRMAERKPVDPARNSEKKFTSVNFGDTGGQKDPTDYEIIEQRKQATDARIKELEEIETELARLETEQQNTLPEYRQPVEYKGYTSSADVFKELTALRDESAALAGQYYQTENESQRTSMGRDPVAARTYADAQKAQEEADKVWAYLSQAMGVATRQMSPEEYTELDKYLKETYGITNRAVAAASRSREYTPSENGYDNLWQLYDELVAAAEAGARTLGERGYNFERMASYDERLKNSEAAAARDREVAAYVNKSGGAAVAANAASILTSMVKGVEYAGQLLGNLGHNSTDDLSKYVPLDTSKMTATRFTDTVREATAEKIESGTKNKGWGKVQSFLYQTGMSIVDSAATISVLGAAAPVVLGGSAAASATKNIVDRGGTNAQALWGGAAAGVAEMFFEKFSVEQLLSPKAITNGKAWVIETLTQAGVEASEEVATEIANILTDAAIMGQKSEFNDSVRYYMEKENMTEEQAKQRAFLDCVAQVGLAGLGGALSGGSMGSVHNTMNRAREYAADKLTGKELQQFDIRLRALERALNAPENSELRRAAEAVVAALDQVEDPTKADISEAQWGRLIRGSTELALGEAATATTPQAKHEATQAAHPEESVMAESAKLFMEQGDDAKLADTKSRIFDRVMQGDTSLTDEELHSLEWNSASTRAVFAAVGYEAPASYAKKDLVAFARSVVNERAKSIKAEKERAARLGEILAGPARAAEAAEAAQAAPEAPVQQPAVAPETTPAPETAQPTPEAPVQQPAETAQQERLDELAEANREQAGRVLTEAVEQAEQKSAPGADTEVTVRMSGGETVSGQEYKARYLAANPGKTEADAQRVLDRAVEANTVFNMDAPSLKAVTGQDSSKSPNRPAETKVERRGKKRRSAGAETTTRERAVEGASGANTRTDVRRYMIDYMNAVLPEGSPRIELLELETSENGFWDEDANRIVLNSRALQDVSSLVYYLGHELVHEADSRTGRKMSEALAEFGKQQYGEETWAELVQEKQKEYRKFYAEELGWNPHRVITETTPAKMEEEVCADMMRDLFYHSDMLGRFAKEHRPETQTARDKVARLRDLIVGQIAGVGDALVAETAQEELSSEAEMLLSTLDGALKGEKEIKVEKTSAKRDSETTARRSLPTRADTNTPAFRAWFHDDSGELTNRDGSPKVFLRGSVHSGSTMFRDASETTSGGIFFSRDLGAAINYAKHTNRANTQTPREFKPRVLDSWAEAEEFVREDLRENYRLEKQGKRWVFSVNSTRGSMDVVDNRAGFNDDADGLAEFNEFYEADLKSWDEVEDYARENFNDNFFVEQFDDGRWYVYQNFAPGWTEYGSYADTPGGLAKFNADYGKASQEYGVENPGWTSYYLSAKKTLVVDAEGRHWTNVDGKFSTTNDVVARAWRQGYDCVVIKNVQDGGAQVEVTFDENDNAVAGEKPIDIYITRKPTQVKSVYNTGSFNARKKDVRYSVESEKPHPDKVPEWDKQVDALRKGEFHDVYKQDGQYRSAMYVAYEPPALLQELGLSDLPLVTTVEHALRALTPRYDEAGNVVDRRFHDITEAQYRRLPELIRNPVAVFKSDPRSDHRGGLQILTDEVDSMGYPIFVTIKPDVREYTFDGVSGPAHFVNVFSRQNYEGFLRGQSYNNGILYVNKEKLDASPLLPQKLATSPTWNDIESGVILQQKDPTVKPGERRFSAPSRPLADPFFSKMEQEIKAFKQAKMGAASVVSYLKGRGVKDEEIKWSGIEQFLEGKKSVTKEELLEFAQMSTLELEEQTLDGHRKLKHYVDNETGEVFLTQEEMREAAYQRAEERGISRENVHFDRYTVDSACFYVHDSDREPGEILWDDDVIMDVEIEYQEKNPQWEDYKTPGGENYRELLYKLPGSDYSNRAMDVHWGRADEGYGVIAHARVQDFKTQDGGTMLFVDEIQSDWHNEGAKSGYATKDVQALQDELRDLRARQVLSGQTEADTAREREIEAKLYPRYAELDARRRELLARLEEGGDLAHVVDEIAEAKYNGNREYALNNVFSARSASMFINDLSGFYGIRLTADEAQALRVFINEKENWDAENSRYVMSGGRDAEMASKPPEAPYAKTYHEYVLKRLLRMAAEYGYDSIGWTTGRMQEERWSSEYAEGYRIEYDQDIPKFLSKYGKQWGARVEKTDLQTKQLSFDEEVDAAEMAEILEDGDAYLRDRRGLVEVWTMKLTDAMREDVLYKGQTRYSAGGDLNSSENGDMMGAQKEVPVNDRQKSREVPGVEKTAGVLHRREHPALDASEPYKADAGNDSRARGAVRPGNAAETGTRDSAAERRDAEYLAAVARRDMATAQKLVDEAADRAGYKTVLFHGTDKEFYEFRLELMELGIHLGSEEQARDRNGKRVLKLFADLGTEFMVFRDYGDWHGKNAAEMMLETEEWEALAGYDDSKFDEVKRRLEAIAAMPDSAETDAALRDYLLSLGWSSITYDNAFEAAGDRNRENWSHIIFNPAAVKSGDPVTYDDNKQIIPLSKRFDRTKTDIRYSAPGKKPKTGGNTGNVNPETGYERGSVADSFMRIWSTNGKGAALSMLENTLVQLAQLQAEQAEQEKAARTAQVFRPRVDLTAERIAREQETIKRLIEKYGEMEQTRAAQQEVHLPEQIDDHTRVAGAAQTMQAAAVTNEVVRDQMNHEILSGTAGLTYNRVGDRATLDKVDEEFEKLGFSQMRQMWDEVANGKNAPGKLDIARAEKLYVEACANKDVPAAMQLAAEIAEAGTRAGQAVQAFTLLRRMTPSGQLYYIQRVVNRLNRDPKQENPIRIDEGLATALLEATTRKDIEDAVDKLIQSIAEQVPVTLPDKWNTWRYFAMLGNPRTHARNLVGNAIFVPARLAKDIIGTGLEHLFLRGDNAGLRTKSITASKELRDFAKRDAAEMRTTLTNTGKYNPADQIRDRRTIYKKLRFLNTLTQKNSKWLENEDWWFLQAAYRNALSHFLSARNADVAALEGENSTPEGRALLEEARLYAVNEAWKATYRDASKIASTLNYMKRNTGKVGAVLLEGVMPFTKTPINIVRRGFEYSPLAVLKFVYDLGNSVVADAQRKAGRKVKRATKTPVELIDEFSAFATGTAVAAIGALLAHLGWLTGALGDDDEDKFAKLQGEQGYSLRVGDVSYTIDWSAPVALPLFVGAEIYNTLADDYSDVEPGKILSAVADGMTSILEPMLSLSMLDGLNDALSANKYGDSNDAIYDVAATAATSYFSQGVPTIFGQVARTFDPDRRTTFTQQGADKVKSTVSRFWQSSVQGKVPGYENEKMLYIDEWGRTDTTGSIALRVFENFLSPGYFNTRNTTVVDEELARLAKALKGLKDYSGDPSAVFPNRAQKYFSVDGENYAMTQAEYQEHLFDRGQTSYRLVNDIIHDEAYAGLNEKEKAEVIALAYDYAAAMAKLHTNSGYKVQDKWMLKLADYEAKGGDAATYLLSKAAGASATEAVASSDDYTAWDAADLLMFDVDTTKSFTDPYTTGYEYKLDSAQQKKYDEIYLRLLREGLADLYDDNAYRTASAEEREDMIAELKKDVSAQTKRDMSDWLYEQGVESKPK